MPRRTPPCTHPSNLTRNGPSNRWKSADLCCRRPRSNMMGFLVRRLFPLLFQSVQDPNTDHIPMFQPVASIVPSALGQTVPPSLSIASTCFRYCPANTPTPRRTPPCTHPSNLTRNGPSNRWKSTDLCCRRPRSNMMGFLVRRLFPLLFQSVQDPNTDHIPMFQPAASIVPSALG